MIDQDRYEYGYLQHGKASEPMRTEKCRIYSYGGGEWSCWYEGKWRKVHIQVKRCFIVYLGERITIVIEGV